MANIFLYTTIAIVVSSSVNCERRAFVSNTNNFLKVVPHHWKHDKEELNRNLVKNARQPWGEMRMGPRPPPLHPNPLAQWPLGVHRNQLSDEGQTKKRIQQLQNKLTPQNNIIPIKTLNHPHPKPEIEVKLQEYKRHKREATQLENYVRQKRDMVIQPEVVMQPHIQPALLQKVEPKNVRPSLNFFIYNQNIYYPEVIDSIRNITGQDPEKDTEKRDKRQILLMIKQQPLNFGKKPRTTPNPFIRETNIADYDIVKTDIDKPELDVIDTVDTDSYQLSETSEIDYESDYTISMSDSEDWDNYPLTTPSGPNPGWGLSTLADIYQRPKKNRAPIARVKRSPKMKRKIGEYKRKLKERRKRKEAKRKRRIIRNSKEDKAVKEEVKEEKIVEKLLKKTRKTTYMEEDLSTEILWSNSTHRIVEDPDAKFEWINRTHYRIYKPNATDEWYNENHVLVCNEEYWKNRTKEDSIKKTKPTIQKEDHDEEEYSEDYDEEFTREEEEERARKIKKNKKYKLKETINQKKSKQVALEEFVIDADKKHKIENKDEQNSETEEEKEIKVKQEKRAKKGKTKKVTDKEKDVEGTEADSDESVKTGKKFKKVIRDSEEKSDKVKLPKKGRTIKKKVKNSQDKTSKKKIRDKTSEEMKSDLDESGETNNENKQISEDKEGEIGIIKQPDKKLKKGKLIKKKRKDAQKKEKSINDSSDESENNDTDRNKHDKSESENDSKNQNRKKKKNPKDRVAKQSKQMKGNTKKSKSDTKKRNKTKQ